MAEQLIICGMHRSGTSLVAAILREAGLGLWQKLAGDRGRHRAGTGWHRVKQVAAAGPGSV